MIGLKEERFEFEGVVTEALPNGMFRVRSQQDDALSVVATVSGSMRRFTVKVLPGDQVTVTLSPYDPSRGRITYRHK